MADAENAPNLPDKFWRMPKTAWCVMRTKHVTEILLRYDGVIIACGQIYDIKSKPIGPGVRRVYLELHK